MISSTTNTTDLIFSSTRTVGAMVYLYNGDTLVSQYKNTDKIKSITIERIGDENKFFGYGVCQKLNLKLIDTNRELDINTSHSIKVYFTVSKSYSCAFPLFYVSEVHRDENTNELSITAYDLIYKASTHTVSELNLTAPYTISSFISACATLLGLAGVSRTNSSAFTDITYETGANFDGTETIREALDAAAEATQTIYYIKSGNYLCFRNLDMSGDAVLEINKDRYFTLDSSTNRRLATICHATELGDNVSASTTESGTTQYIRNNPFWDLREDIATLVNDALAAVGGLTINQFVCDWRGHFLLEVGDKISLTTKDNNTVTSYVLNDVISYDGSYKQETQWNYEDNDTETESNPATIGDALKQTYARVDKVNKEIELVAGEVDANTEAISSLEINTEGISASVTRVEENTTAALENVNGDISTLTQRVEASMTSEDVTLQIQSELSNGVDKVTTYALEILI